MWSYEHSVMTSASQESVWRLWADVAGWKSWNADIETIEVSGSFEAGTEIVMNPDGEQPVRLRLVEVVAPSRFVDEADLGEVVVRTTHQFEGIDAEHGRVIYRMEITGPTADRIGPELGPAISGDFPETMNALVRLAEKG